MRLATAELEQLFGGRLTWQEALRGGPPWLRSELVVTELARRRLREWAEAGCCTSEPEKVLLCEVGDGARQDVLAALRRIPPPVLDFVARRCAILALGTGVGGCATSSLELDGRILLVLATGRGDPQEAQATTGHEIAHAWLHQDDGEPRAMSSIGETQHHREALNTFADRFGTRSQLQAIEGEKQQARARREREACALAQAWGFTGRAASPERWRRR